MKSIKFCICALILLLTGFTAKAAKIDTLKVFSPAMKAEVNVVCITPQNLNADNKYPVVYLLHGHGGNHFSWLSIKPELPKIADDLGYIFVCPDGKNSWYWDSPTNPSYRYETFMSHELISFIDGNYPTKDDKEHRAITGLSMGGHGAMWLAIRHQDIFGACGSMSGGLDIRPFPEAWNMNEQLGVYEENKRIWDEHTVINQLDKLKESNLAIYICCGYDDFFLEVNNHVHEILVDMNYPHDFTIREGKHNAPFWNNALDYHLLFFTKFFNRK